MKKVLSVLLLLSVLFLCASCAGGNTETTTGGEATTINTVLTNDPTSAPVEDNGPKHYEIELNKDNYTDFLYQSSESLALAYGAISGYKQIISGALSFAYYENVVVTFHIKYEYFGGQVYQGEYKVKLNAAGYAEFCADDEALLAAISCSKFDSSMMRTFSITNVTGKVNFVA